MLLLLLACTRAPPPPDLLVSVGDPTPESLVLQLRAAGTATVTVGSRTWTATPDPGAGHTARVRLDGLPADTAVAYRVQAGEQVVQGAARTAPLADQARAVRLAVVGDLAGHRACRPIDGGWPILDRVAEQSPDLLVANGDMIYADYACDGEDEQGQQVLPGTFASVAKVDWTDARALREAFHGHWAYGREDPAHRRLLARTALVAQWDDHEVINDFGAAWERYEVGDVARPGYPTLVSEGAAAFHAWNPIDGAPASSPPIHRRLRWGQHLELFITDARSFRSPNPEPDGPDKMMLGQAQLDWLVEGLTTSTATWKVVSMSVPLGSPMGSRPWTNGRDGWASGTGAPDTPAGTPDHSARTGYERELAELFARTDAVRGLLFVVTDAHYAQNIRYPRGDRERWELISGPLSARRYAPEPLDPTFSPDSPYVEYGFANFGVLEIDLAGRLRWAVVDETGTERLGSVLSLSP